MSWLKENYEKAILAGALVLMLCIVYARFLGADNSASDKPLPVREDSSISENLLSDMALVLEARQNPSEIRPKLEGGREVKLFIGQTLFMKKDSDLPLDIYTGTNVHEGIPNEWWRKYNIDIGYKNSPERDFDKDGFTNREEFDYQTNPSDKKDYPSLLEKIIGKNIGVFKIQMRWSAFDDKSITIYYQDTKPTRQFSQRVRQGESFFIDKGLRFILSKQPVTMLGPNGRKQDVYEVEDKTPRYKGSPKQFFKLFRRGPKNNFNEIQDRSVILSLNALGQEGDVFEVKELEMFSLPYDPAAKNKPFKVTKIDPIPGQVNTYTVEITENVDGKMNSKILVIRKQ